MPTEIGSAYLTLIPSMTGFSSKVQSSLDKSAGGSGGGGSSIGRKLGTALAVGLGGGIVAAGAGIKGAITKAGDFDKTIRTIGANAGLAGPGLKSLADLALEFGAKTTFSAQGAADAMLELSKGGLTPAQIKAGALASTLTLASAGGLQLGEAAGYVVQGLTTFGLKASDAGSVAAALAGAANASTASVQSIGLALSQVGPGAVNMGLSIQETTAALAAFDNNGIKGADAGTSLKQALTSLIPQSTASFNAMNRLGLQSESAGKLMGFLRDNGVQPLSSSIPGLSKQVEDVNAKMRGIKPGTTAAHQAFDKLHSSGAITQSAFFDAAGKAKSLAEISGALGKALNGLSQEQKSQALTTIFGSDASRAAAVLAKEGAAGITSLVKATSDTKAATDLAKVGTQGFAGALENFKGSVETAQITLGTALLPVATRVFNGLATLTNATVPIATRALTALRLGFNGQVNSTGYVGAFQRIGAAARTAVTFLTGVFNSFRGGEASTSGLTSKASALATTLGTGLKNGFAQVAAIGGPLLRTAFNLLGTALAFVAKHATLLASIAIPLLIGGFVLLKAKQAASLALDILSLPIKIAEIAANFALASANRALAFQLSILTGQQSKGIIASIAARVAALAQAAATGIATVAMRIYVATMSFGIGAVSALTGAFRALGLAIAANPIGFAIAGLILLGAALVIAYKHSSVFRSIVNTAFTAVKVGALALVVVAVGAFKFLLGVWLAVAGGIVNGAAKALGWVPGLGGKLKGAAAAFNGFKTDAIGALDGVEQKAKTALAAQTAALNPPKPAAPPARAARAPVSVAALSAAADLPSRGASRVTNITTGPVIASDPAQLHRQLQNRERLARLAN